MLNKPLIYSAITLTSLASLVLSISLFSAPPTAALGSSDDGASLQQTDSGGGTVNVNVSWSYTAAGSDDSSETPSGGEATTQTTTTVHPVCWYEPGMTGPELSQWATSKEGQSVVALNKLSLSEDFPDWNKRASDLGGRWYNPTCSSHYFNGDQQAFSKTLDDFFSKGHVWVPEGEQPPAPLIDGDALAQAAWKAVTIPSPTVENNPKIGDSGATLVGMDTWVWATGDTPKTITATASAGPASATVTASSTGLQLSAPDGRPSCQGFGIPWHRGMPEGSSPCTILFTRSSAHLGGTTPLTVSVAYSATFTASDGTSGPLDGITTTNTLPIPVAEVQTLNTSGSTHNN